MYVQDIEAAITQMTQQLPELIWRQYYSPFPAQNDEKKCWNAWKKYAMAHVNAKLKISDIATESLMQQINNQFYVSLSRP